MSVTTFIIYHSTPRKQARFLAFSFFHWHVLWSGIYLHHQGFGVGVGEGAEVGVGVGTDVIVGCGVGVTVGTGVEVAVGTGVGVEVGSGVDVALGEGVAVGVGVEKSSNPHPTALQAFILPLVQ